MPGHCQTVPWLVGLPKLSVVSSNILVDAALELKSDPRCIRHQGVHETEQLGRLHLRFLERIEIPKFTKGFVKSITFSFARLIATGI